MNIPQEFKSSVDPFAEIRQRKIELIKKFNNAEMNSKDIYLRYLYVSKLLAASILNYRNEDTFRADIIIQDIAFVHSKSIGIVDKRYNEYLKSRREESSYDNWTKTNYKKYKILIDEDGTPYNKTSYVFIPICKYKERFGRMISNLCEAEYIEYVPCSNPYNGLVGAVGFSSTYGDIMFHRINPKKISELNKILFLEAL